jgi:ligand-binding sensor domain-containing protein/two-component sensor histidine kinase
MRIDHPYTAFRIIIAIALNCWLNPLLIYPVYCFDKNVTFRHLTVRSGLSQSAINAIFQDSSGKLWIGTEDGLNRFDGYVFDHFKHDPQNTNSLLHSWIWDISEDWEGNLWVATWAGLCKMNSAKTQITRYVPIEGDSTSLSNFRTDCLLTDRSGTLWIGTWGGGLHRYNKSQDNFKQYLPGPGDNELSHGFVRRVYEDADGQIWVGTWGGGLCRYDPILDNFEKNYGAENAELIERSVVITSISDGPDGELWIGTYENGVVVFDKSEKKWIDRKETFFDILKTKSITSIFKDNDGFIWVGTQRDGLFLYQGGEFRQIQQKETSEYGLLSNHVTTIFQEKNGAITIGNTGLSIYHKSRMKFIPVRTSLAGVAGLSDANIWSFAEYPPGVLWVGSQTGGIDLVSVSDGMEVLFMNEPWTNLLRGKYVKAISVDITGNVWLGAIGDGLVKVSPDRTISIDHNARLTDPALSQQIRINALLSVDSIIYIGTGFSGVFIYNQFTQQIARKYFVYNDTMQVSSEYVNTLFHDQQGNIWLGSGGGGLSKMSLETDTLIRYFHNSENNHSLSSDIVNCIFQDNEGVLWLGTNYGLNELIKEKDGKFNSFNEEFRNYSLNEGLPNEIVYGIQGDMAGNLWLSTNVGLSKFDLSTRTFTNYTVEDGLQENEFNGNASLRLSNGHLVFGGINGLNIFHPDSIRLDTLQPEIILATLLIAGTPVNVDSIISIKQKIKLPFTRNFISVEYAAIEYVAPDKIKYAIKLEGADEDFFESGSRRFTTYASLSPGDYVLQAKCTNRDGIWGSEKSLLSFTIMPPFYLSWWFIFLAILIVSIIIYGLFRWRLTQLLEIERIRSKISADLHDDIGSSLTKISMFSELISSQHGSEAFADKLTSIRKLSGDVISSMSDIVWSIDARHDYIENMIDRMKDFALSTCEQTDIKVQFDLNIEDPKRKIKPLYRQNLYLIFKEAVSNVLKHSGADTIFITIIQSGENLNLQIQDNGKGLHDKKFNLGGNGLLNMELRTKRMKGKFQVNDNQGLSVSCSVKFAG